MAAKRLTSVVIDPIAMGITNKVASGSKLSGINTFNGGILIQGVCDGTLVVYGPLVLSEGAQLAGQIEVHGDAYIFGQIGSSGDETTTLTCNGELHLTSKCVAYGRLRFANVTLYKGGQINSVMQSLADTSQTAVALEHGA